MLGKEFQIGSMGNGVQWGFHRMVEISLQRDRGIYGSTFIGLWWWVHSTAEEKTKFYTQPWDWFETAPVPACKTVYGGTRLERTFYWPSKDYYQRYCRHEELYEAMGIRANNNAIRDAAFAVHQNWTKGGEPPRDGSSLIHEGNLPFRSRVRLWWWHARYGAGVDFKNENGRTRIETWRGPKWSYVEVNRYFWLTLDDSKSEFRIVKGTIDQIRGTARYVRRNNLLAIVIWNSYFSLCRPVCDKIWKLLHDWSMLTLDSGSVPTWRNITWPGRGS